MSKSVLKNIYVPISSHPGLFAFIMLCCLAIPLSGIIIGDIHLKYCLFLTCFQSIFWAYLVCLIVTLIRRRWLQVTTAILLSLPFAVGAFLELGSWAVMRYFIDDSVFLLTKDTDVSEMSGFFSHYLTSAAILRLTGYLAVFGWVWFLISLIIRKSYSMLRKFSWIIPIALIPGAIIIALFLTSTSVASSSYKILSRNGKINQVRIFSDPVVKYMMASRNLNGEAEGIKDYQAYQQQVWGETGGVEVCDSATYNVAVIFGESLIKKMYDNGIHDPEILPNISSAANSGNLVAFNDMKTVWALTSRAVRNAALLSDIRETDYSNGVYFPMLAAKAGWEVNFYSNQIFNPYMDADLGQILLNPMLADEVYTNWGDRKFHNDREWIDYIRREYYPKERANRTLSIYHFWGIHLAWATHHRSPGKISVDHFPSSQPIELRRELADYASSMWENDSIVNLIFRHLDKKGPAVLVYFSDHGEMLREDMPGAARNKEEFDNKKWVNACFNVPMYIWMNDSFIKENQQLAQDIRAAASRPGTTDNIGHAILHLLGVCGKYYRPDLDILSPEYVARPRKALHGQPLD